MGTYKNTPTRRSVLKKGLTLSTLATAGLHSCGRGDSSPPGNSAETVAVEISPAPTREPANPAPSALTRDTLPNKPVALRILWTGDTHGQLRPIYHRDIYETQFLTQNGIAAGSPEAYCCASTDFLALANAYGRVGGYAHLATLINQERAVYPEQTLLLDSGDAWYGSALALLTQGRACVEVMNAIGYDAMTLHWEFNLGKQALLERISEASFPVLAQNLVDTDFEDRILAPSIVRVIGNTRVAIVGQAYPFSLLTTEDRDANPGMRMGYRDEELQTEIDRLRRVEGATIVILLSHMGLPQDRFMAQHLQNVDVIVGGHTHDILWQPEQIGQTLLVHGGSHGKFLGELDLTIVDGAIHGFTHRLIPVLAAQVAPDPEIAALIDRLYQPYEQTLSAIIGQTASLLYRRALLGGTTDAFMGKVYREIGQADIGCTPGWRFGTSILPGAITVEDVYNAMKPTPSPLYNVKLPGKMLRQIMEDNLDNVFSSEPLPRLGGDVSRCLGVKAELNRQGARKQRVGQVQVNGEPLERARIYQVATSGGRVQYRDPTSDVLAPSATDELIRYIQEIDDPIRVEPAPVYRDI